MARRKDTLVGPVCEWDQETSEEGSYWDTACGEAFQFIEGGPRENQIVFCCYCGRRVHAKPVMREAD